MSDHRRRLGVRAGDVLVVYAGRLIEAKGVLDVLEAFSRLDDRADRRVRLAVAGDGPMASAVMRSAHKDGRIVPLGSLDAPQVHDLLVEADVVVHPSAYPEGLPTVLLEAAAAGVAVIATPAGGTTELIQTGENGLIVPVHDVAALQHALAVLTSDGELRARLGAAARRTVREKFDWQTIADTLETELSALCDRSHGPSVATARRVRFDWCCHSSGRRRGHA